MLSEPQSTITIRKKTIERLRAFQAKYQAETERRRSYDELLNLILDGEIKPA